MIRTVTLDRNQKPADEQIKQILPCNITEKPNK